MAKTIAPDLRIGRVLVFKKYRTQDVARYGATATITGRQETQSRPFGATKLLVDLTTESGVRVQWDVATVRTRFREEGL